jgi:hypothetical protein
MTSPYNFHPKNTGRGVDGKVDQPSAMVFHNGVRQRIKFKFTK